MMALASGDRRVTLIGGDGAQNDDEKRSDVHHDDVEDDEEAGSLAHDDVVGISMTFSTWATNIPQEDRHDGSFFLSFLPPCTLAPRLLTVLDRLE